MEHKDKKDISLQLKNLQEFVPKNDLWSKMEKQLDQAALKQNLDELPIHDPIADSWLKLEKSLDRNSRIKWWSMAACVLVVFSFSVFYFQSKEDLVYAQKSIEEIKILPENLSSEKAYKEILAFCEIQTVACDDHEFENLKAEYEYLKMAENDLREVMGDYNIDEGLLQQLEAIEREKTQLINQLAKLI